MQFKSLVLAVLILGPGLMAPMAGAAIPAAERQALIDLYNNTGGAYWVFSFNWRNADDTDFNDAGTECTWAGVACNVAGDSVVQISLGYNGLTGSIPATIADLSNLEILNLKDSPGLSNSIPTEIGDLLQLTALDLYGGGFSGSIPSELGNLSNLTSLDLSRNQLRGEVPTELANLTGLSSCSVHYNAVWTDDPALQSFLVLKCQSNWEETQTVAPTDVASSFQDSSSITLDWIPIDFDWGGGGYSVFVSPRPSSGTIYTDGFEAGDTEW